MRLTRRDLLLGALVGSVAAFAYLVPPGVATSLDYLQWQSLNRQYWVEAVRHLRVPLWNPHVGLGRPFLADVETASLYPGTLLFLAGLDGGLLASVFLHAALAAVGMRLLARGLGIPFGPAVLMAVSFVFIGPFSGRLLVGQLGYAQGACYLPLAFALALRLQHAPSLRRCALLALVFGLQVLAGHPQIAWVTWLGLALFMTGRRLHDLSRAALKALARDLGLLAASVAWGLVVAGATLLPYVELVARSNRAERSLAFASSFALPLAALHSLLVAPERSIYAGLGGWENEIYSNAVVVLAGLAAIVVVRRREATGCTLLLVVSLLLAVGDRTPVFAAAYHLIPGVALFRLHSRIATLAPFALICLAGLYLSEPRPSAAHRRAPLVVALAVVAALGAWIPWRQGLEVGAAWPLLRAGVVAAAAAAIVLWTRTGLDSTRGAVLALAVLGLDTALVQATRRGVNAQLGAGAVPPGEAVLAELLRQPRFAQAGGAPPRVLAPLSVARYNAGMALGYSTPASYVGVALDRAFTFIHQSIGVAVPLHNTGPASAIFARPFPYDSTSLVIGFDSPRQAFVQPLAPDPRAYIVACAEAVGGWREAVQRIAAGHDVHRCGLVEDGTKLRAPLAPGTAHIVSFAPERVVLDVQSAGPALLVLGEAWYPGWEASAGGRPVSSFPVNAWMRGALVPDGGQQVVFTFHSRLLPGGAAVSLAGLLLAGWSLFRRKANKERPAAEDQPC